MISSFFSLPLVAQLTLGSLLAASLFVLSKWWDNYTRLRNIPRPDGASKIWGHEWLEFEDDCGSQWRQWITRFGPNFKLKAAWGVRLIFSNNILRFGTDDLIALLPSPSPTT
ncbi:hypothetical protein FRC18_006765 [Serendipita sp. 400]|nr:hypothetical protein FRC18_006765 [Serendipita sp. 400]